MLHSEDMKGLVRGCDWRRAVLGVFSGGLPLMCAIGCLLTAVATAAVDRNLAPDLRRAPVMVRAA